MTTLVGLFIIGLGLGLGSLYSINGLSPKSHSHTTTTALPSVTASGNGSVSVTCFPAPVVVGSKTSCTAILANYSKTPSGTVSWKSNETGTFSANSCTISSGSCSVSYKPSSTGVADINGTYSADKNSSSSFGTYSLAIAREATQITLSCSAVLTVGESSKCTTTVAGYGTPSGNASFTGTDSGTFNPVSCVLNRGSCSVQYTPLSVSSESITASYTGDSNNNASSSLPYVFTVGASTSSVSVKCSPKSAAVGSSTTCTATVNGYNPTGTVTWQTNATGIFSSSTCTLTSGSCQVTYAPSTTASANLTASYSGDSNNLGSTGSSALIVTQAVTNTSVNCVPSSIEVGSLTICNATVSGGVSPSGSVSFTTSGSGSFTPAAASCSLVSGSCTVSFNGATPGSVTVTASYGGDIGNSGSSSSTQISVAVGLVAPTISANPTTIDSGQSSNLVTITSFSGGLPSYTCQWLEQGHSNPKYVTLGSPFGCNVGDTPSISSGALSTGTWSFELQITDSSTPAVTVTSNAVTVTVNSAFTGTSVSISALPTTIDIGQSVQLTVTWTGSGTSPYSVQLQTSSSSSCSNLVDSGSPVTGIGGTTKIFQVSPSPGTYYYCATVSDSAGSPESSSTTSAAQVVVNSQLTVTISPSSETTNPYPSYANFTAVVSGGSGSYSYIWDTSGVTGGYSPSGCGTGPTCNITSGIPGTYTISVKVSDGLGAPQTKTATLSVVNSTTSSMVSIFSINSSTIAQNLTLFSVIAVSARGIQRLLKVRGVRKPFSLFVDNIHSPFGSL